MTVNGEGSWHSSKYHNSISVQELKPGPPTDTAGVSFTSCLLAQGNCLSLHSTELCCTYMRRTKLLISVFRSHLLSSHVIKKLQNKSPYNLHNFSSC